MRDPFDDCLIKKEDEIQLKVENLLRNNKFTKPKNQDIHGSNLEIIIIDISKVKHLSEKRGIKYGRP